MDRGTRWAAVHGVQRVGHADEGYFSLWSLLMSSVKVSCDLLGHTEIHFVCMKLMKGREKERQRKKSQRQGDLQTKTCQWSDIGL